MRLLLFILFFILQVASFEILGNEDNSIANTSLEIINICKDPSLTIQYKIDNGSLKMNDLISAINKQGDEFDTEYLAKAYDSFSSLFSEPFYAHELDKYNKAFLERIDRRNGIFIDCFLLMASSYIEAFELNRVEAINSYSYHGDAQRGLSFMESAQIDLKKLSDYDKARIYSLKGSLYLFGKDYANAQEHFRQSLSWVESSKGKSSPEYIFFKMQQELPFSYSGDFTNALNLALETEKLFKSYSLTLPTLKKTVLGTDFQEYASLLNRIASYYSRLGEKQKELKYNELSLNAFYDTYGEEKKYIFTSYQPAGLPTKGSVSFLTRSLLYVKRSLAENYYQEGKRKESLTMYKELVNDYKSEANKTKTFSELNANEIKILLEPLNTLAPMLAYRYPEDPTVHSMAYDCALLCKNFSLYADNLVKTIVYAENDQETKEIYQNILSLNEQLLKGSANETNIRNEIRHSTQYLLNEIDFSAYGKLINCSWKDVQNAIEPDAIAIEFMLCKNQEGDNLYQANLIKKEGVPTVVTLCKEKTLKSIQNPYESNNAYNCIWGRIEKELNGVKKIYFSPTGLLYNMAIEYFADTTQTSINEKYNIYRLSSTKELTKERVGEDFKKSVIYGGVFYSPEGERAVGSDVRGGLNYLPETKKELDNVKEILLATTSVSSFSANLATEESFKSLSGKKIDILHIATHGFYWTEKNAKRMRYPFLIKSQSRPMEDRALSRSGLFFAGANKTLLTGADNYREDGVLTSNEIAQMDLENVDLTILSACQTGLGDIDDEGVFGLQRGFKKAGAHSLMMSLWKVDDEATQIFMTEFYKHYISSKKQSESFVKAQKILRQCQNGRFDKPQYWAAFILLDAQR